MKENFKTIVGVLAGFVLGVGIPVFANQYVQVLLNNEINLEINGKNVVMKDETTNAREFPITYNDRTYIPLRSVATLLGAKVDYDNNSKTAIIVTQTGEFYKPNYYFPNSNTELVKKDDLVELDLKELDYAKNEIFARYGYDFSSDLKFYFDSKPWYTKKDGFKMNVSDLNNIEQQNISLINNEITNKNKIIDFNNADRVSELINFEPDDLKYYDLGKINLNGQELSVAYFKDGTKEELVFINDQIIKGSIYIGKATSTLEPGVEYKSIYKNCPVHRVKRVLTFKDKYLLLVYENAAGDTNYQYCDVLDSDFEKCYSFNIKGQYWDDYNTNNNNKVQVLKDKIIYSEGSYSDSRKIMELTEKNGVFNINTIDTVTDNCISGAGAV